jgi:hypothetical protein
MLKSVCANPAIPLAVPQRATRLIPLSPEVQAGVVSDQVLLGTRASEEVEPSSSTAPLQGDTVQGAQTSELLSKSETPSPLSFNPSTGTLTLFYEAPAALADQAIFRPGVDEAAQTTACLIRSAVARFEVRLPH